MSAQDRELVNRHIESLLSEATAKNVPHDLIGRILVSAAIGIWRNARSVEDIASELNFIIDNLDADADYPFMRP